MRPVTLSPSRALVAAAPSVTGFMMPVGPALGAVVTVHLPTEPVADFVNGSAID